MGVQGYERTFWVDHKETNEDVFQEQSLGGGKFRYIPADRTLLEQGTPQSADNFNKPETGVFSATEIAKEAVRVQHHQQQALDQLKGEIVTVTLTNTLAYPFSNSGATVALAAPRNTLSYDVRVIDAPDGYGTIGRILTYDKQRNGFKVRCTGSAATVTLTLLVTGGMY